MKLFKTIDERFKEIGFDKLRDGDYIVSYERYVKEYDYTERLDIVHKASGRHIVQCYDPDLFDAEGIGNCCIGMTYYEMRLAMKKMQQKGWK